MSCGPCQKIFSRAKSSAPGSWQGEEPVYYRPETRQDGWEGSHHTEDGSFLRSCRARCYVCATLQRDFSHELRQHVEQFRTYYRLSPTSDRSYILEFTLESPPTDNHDARVVEPHGRFLLVPEENHVSADVRALPENTGSRECMIQVTEWLRECDEKHDRCKPVQQHKDDYCLRLLSLATAKPDMVRLVTIAQHARRPKYTTMSHCWDTGPKSQGHLMLTKRDQEYLLDGFAIRDLPSRFKDAIEISKQIGVEYIWIDAFCVIQGNVKDWREQSNVMGDIYSRSYCNIAATGSVSSDGGSDRGLLRDRSTSMIGVQSVPTPDNANTNHVLIYDDMWCNSLCRPRLHKRGWVQQERLLSSRTLHYGQEQIFWECRSLMACESYPDGLPPIVCENQRTLDWRQSDEMLLLRKELLSQSYLARCSRYLTSFFVPRQSSPAMQEQQGYLLQSYLARSFRYLWGFFATRQPQVSDQDLKRMYRIWSNMMERYMKCDLTVSRDKLVAISGLAQLMAAITQETYLAGHWKNQSFPQSLLWYVPSRRRADGSPSARVGTFQPNYYRAPSWSFASMDAEITWNWPADSSDTLIEISNVYVTETPESNFGEVTDAELSIKGVRLEAKLRVLNTSESGQYELRLESNPSSAENFDAWDFEATTIEPVVYLDEALQHATGLQHDSLPGVDEALQSGTDSQHDSPNRVDDVLPSAADLQHDSARHVDETIISAKGRRQDSQRLVSLVPICRDWGGRSGDDKFKVAGLLLMRVPWTSSSYYRIGVFALTEAQTDQIGWENLVREQKDDLTIL